MNSPEVHKIWSEQCEERSLRGKSPAQSEQWYCWIGRRRIISASAENRGNSYQRKHPDPGARSELRLPPSQLERE